jgi:hypothetical protein
MFSLSSFAYSFPKSNWRNPQNPDDYSRITITEESFTDFTKINFNRMPDTVSFIELLELLLFSFTFCLFIHSFIHAILFNYNYMYCLQVKEQMYAQHLQNPEEYSVANLATSYGVSQPRVQAILLLKAWEKQDEANGVNSVIGNQLEEMVGCSYESTTHTCS